MTTFESHVWGVTQCIISRVARNVPPQTFAEACKDASEIALRQSFTDEEIEAGILQARDWLTEDGYQL
ncbi:hypothetical protein [Ethanoligenens harbinense]|uniref:Uncharacterized protein n=1 Tax=Ethanoligenens harbinense (strain DSM 18485 / JCM 12961 / CGMCC 1.5033 / YUAN-3) TaxID=663278 RepID=E6U6U5_ETHHY|nr:hypothetical protein [Ethanoligenens harbinense]ADU26912.1 hypothetical protein Ethha_1374 [Ethanoligenens harbinense YUAN-3]AVQ96008.1 hypothetical protein CXQ68_07085 [Ethanoligenens harbinense YUAN-3]AYF38669.1 hypothetical protein CXP51_06955 [Ethanoligenens harbinense]AYF41416.1 hypothetical protein CN246_07095 [Ethanoligenens harbinense]QCN92250.1 hypothetical protein DRA42_07115 [Ethanoligenens harbinense]